MYRNSSSAAARDTFQTSVFFPTTANANMSKTDILMAEGCRRSFYCLARRPNCSINVERCLNSITYYTDFQLRDADRKQVPGIGNSIFGEHSDTIRASFQTVICSLEDFGMDSEVIAYYGLFLLFHLLRQDDSVNISTEEYLGLVFQLGDKFQDSKDVTGQVSRIFELTSELLHERNKEDGRKEGTEQLGSTVQLEGAKVRSSNNHIA